MLSITSAFSGHRHAFADPESLYHDDRLVVKLRATSAERAAEMGGLVGDPVRALAGGPVGALAGGLVPAAITAVGMSLLDRMDRAGMIRRMTPLDGRARQAEPEVHTSGLVARAFAAAVAPSPQEPSYVTGLQMIQTQEETDLAELQRALGEDPNVEFVSRVPRRWLTARKSKAAKKSATKKKTAKKKAKKRSARSATKKKAPTIAAVPPNPLVMWNLQRIQWNEAREAGLDDASSIRVAVLDTGIDTQHPDLPDDLEYVFDYETPGATLSDQDIVGHGTHVSGTIGALINGNVGINGVCNCRLSQYKIFEDVPQFSEVVNGWHAYDYFVNPEAYHLALSQCLDDEAQVVNLSIGGFAVPSAAEQLLFAELIDNNVCVVAAMGNEDTVTPSYPAAIDGVIAVGASRPSDDRADFSNKGDHIDILAPGEDIWSTLPTYSGHSRQYHHPTTGQVFIQDRETMYDAWPGTSMASPHVAAAAALLLHHDSSLTPAQIHELLIDNADKVPAMGGSDFTSSHGHGRLNLARLADAVA